MTEPRKPVRLETAWVFDGPGGVRIEKAERPSTQLPEDPFGYKGPGEGGLQEPPYDLPQLASMLETNTLHYRCVKQKGADILGRGITLRAKELPEGEKPSAEEEDRYHEFVRSVEEGDDRGDESLIERLVHAHEDFEGVGWAVIEVSRNKDGRLDGLWHVPGHTVRAHKDGRRYAQKRADKLVWFKRFGVVGDVDRKDGGWSDRAITDVNVRGNELIVIRNYTPRSSHYGLPDHIPAMAAIAGWRAQAEFNVRFFDNQAIPAYAVIVEGAELSPELEETIRGHFIAIKGQPHKTLVIPVPGVAGDEASQPKIRFEKLSLEIKDASFRSYKQDNALEICIAHGMPPYRVGWPIVGSLGGSTAEEMTQIYNDGVVQPRQEIWEQRLNSRLFGSRGLDIHNWELKANELDTRNEMRDLEKAEKLYGLGVTNPNDHARMFGYDQRQDPGGKAYIPVPLAPGTGIGVSDVDPSALGLEEADAIAKRWKSEVAQAIALRKRIETLVSRREAAAA